MSFFERRIGFEYKGDADLVTEADRASEQLIVSRLRNAWPDHDIVGEEGTRDTHGGGFRWYVDPLDGTTNFAHGYPVFCVSMGLEYQGQLIAGDSLRPHPRRTLRRREGKWRNPQRQADPRLPHNDYGRIPSRHRLSQL